MASTKKGKNSETKSLRQLIRQYKADFDQYKDDQLAITSKLTAHLDMIKLKEIQKRKTAGKLKALERQLDEQANQISSLIDQLNDKLLQYRCECGRVNKICEKFKLTTRSSDSSQPPSLKVDNAAATTVVSDIGPYLSGPADSGFSMIGQPQYNSAPDYLEERSALSPALDKLCQTGEDENVNLSPLPAVDPSRVSYTVPMLAYQNQRIRGYEDLGPVELLKKDGSINFNPNDVCRPWKDEYWKFMTKGDTNAIMRSRLILLPVTMGGILVEAVLQGANTEEFSFGLYVSGIEYNCQRKFPETVYARVKVRDRNHGYKDSGQYKLVLSKVDGFARPVSFYVKFGNCHRSRVPEIVIEFQDSHFAF